MVIQTYSLSQYTVEDHGYTCDSDVHLEMVRVLINKKMN